MFLTELDADAQKAVVDFFTNNKTQIVSDLFEGDGIHAAGWVMVAFKATANTRWALRKSGRCNSILWRRPSRDNKAGKPEDRPDHNAAKGR